MPKINYRFAVHDSVRNTIAATWNCGVRGSDIYLFSRAIGYALKFSLHTLTGQCHVKYSPIFYEKNKNVLDDNYVDKWTYKRTIPYVNPLTIVTPPAAVNNPRDSAATRKINLIPAATDGKAIFVGLFIVAPETQTKGESLFSHTLPDGDEFVLAAVPNYMPKIRAPEKWPVNFYEGHDKDDIKDIEHLRMMLLAGDGEYRQVFDFVGGPTKQSQ